MPPDAPAPTNATKPGPAAGFPWTLYGFLVTTIAVVGLVGLFATFAAPLTLQRALARDAALDSVAALAASGDTPGLLALRPRLDDSAEAVLPGGRVPADLALRISRERPAARDRLARESAAIAQRLRLMIVLVTGMAAVFAAPLLRAARR